MSERNPIPSTADKIEWNTNPTNPETDPATQRAAGWAVNEIPDAQEFNYVWTMQGEYFAWLRGFAAREWTDLSEGIAASAYRDLFRVTVSAGVMAVRLVQEWNRADVSSVGGNPQKVLTDGEQIYYHTNTATDHIVAANPIDGSLVWDRILTVGYTASALATDGLFVYYISGNAANTGLRKLDRTTGADDSAAGAEYAMTALVANGVYAVGVAPNSNAGSVVFYTVATPIETGVVTPSTALAAVAIDYDACYVGGTRNTNDIWAYNLVDRTLKWQVTLDATAPVVNAIAADGDCVYVATNSVALGAGGTANIFCLERFSGTLLWTLDIGTDTDAIAVDDRYLYAIDQAGLLSVIKLRSPVPAVIDQQADWNGVVTDGVSLTGSDLSTATNFQRHTIGGATKTYMRALGSDPNRRPFYTLAVPVDGRI